MFALDYTRKEMYIKCYVWKRLSFLPLCSLLGTELQVPALESMRCMDPSINYSGSRSEDQVIYLSH